VSILEVEDLVTTAVYRAIVPAGYRRRRTWTGTSVCSHRQSRGMFSRRHTLRSIRTLPIGWRISGVRSPPQQVSTTTSATRRILERLRLTEAGP